MFLASALVADSSLSRGTLLTMLPFAAALAIASLGQTLVVMQGGIDLSVAGGLSLYVVIVTHYPAGDNARVLPAIGIAFAAQSPPGWLNGFLVGRLGLNPIVATLGTNALLYGAVLWSRPAPPRRPPRGWRASATGCGSASRLRCTSPSSPPPSSRPWSS